MSESVRSTDRSRSPESVGEFQTPFSNAMFKEFVKQYPEKAEALKMVLKEIDTQAIDNVDVFRSQQFPGVAFSHTKLTVTPELIEKLGSLQLPETAATKPEATERAEEAEENLDAKRHDYFLFTAMNPPPGGHAFTVQDVAIDRFIRLMSAVASALSRGEKPPEVNIYLLGDPTGLGGSVTPGWLSGILAKGEDQEGELRAEFIAGVEPTNLEAGKRPHIVLQGVSNGALIAEKTSQHLPEHLRAHTQRLLDNPAGDHGDEAILERARRGLQVLDGYRQELAYQKEGDIMQTLGAHGEAFMQFLSNHLEKEKGIQKDSKTQAVLKYSVIAAVVANLVKGTSLDTENVRSFIRRGIDDPVTKSDARTRAVQEKVAARIPHPFFKRGKSSEVPFKGRHFFMYDRYHRWSTILDLAQNYKNIKPEDWKLERPQSP